MNIRVLTKYALLIAICAIGGQIHLWGSISFDSSPAFVGALVLGPMAGAILGALGHLAAAAYSGFPLGPAVHGVVALIMACTAGMVGLTFHKMTSSFSYVVSGIVGYIINVWIGLAITALMMGSTEVIGLMWGLLSLDYVWNYVLAALVVSQLNRVFGGTKHE